jgi:hypothetical protein
LSETDKKHKHTRTINGQKYEWNVYHLWEKAKELPQKAIEIESLKEVDKVMWFNEKRKPTLKRVVEHMKRIKEADLSIPIILNSDGTLMDGGHRVARAILENQKTILAVQFEEMPDPDHICLFEEEIG